MASKNEKPMASAYCTVVRASSSYPKYIQEVLSSTH